MPLFSVGGRHFFLMKSKLQQAIRLESEEQNVGTAECSSLRGVLAPRPQREIDDERIYIEKNKGTRTVLKVGHGVCKFISIDFDQLILLLLPLQKPTIRPTLVR